MGSTSLLTGDISQDLAGQFKPTARAVRNYLRTQGFDPIYIYNTLRAYKLTGSPTNPRT